VGCSDDSGPGASGTAGGSAGNVSTTSTSGSSGTTGASGGAGGSNGSGGAAGGQPATGAGGTSGSMGTGGSGGAPTDGGRPDAAGDGAIDGASDAATPMLVPPIVRGNLHVFEFGNTTFAVDGTRGARIVTFSMDGKNILTGPNVNALYWGSTFWTAPESDWMPNLVVPIDSAPYAMTVAADQSITAVGGTGMVTATKLVAVTKKFTADLPTRSIVIDYTMTNKGTASIQIGHWEVTRVPPNGLTFYPAGTTAPMSYGTIQVQRIGAYLWFDHTAFAMGTASKSFGDGSGGWVAHVMADPAGDILLIKKFPDIPTGTAGTGHGEVEIFAAADRSYVEVEDHNQQVMIAAGQSSPWQVRWYLRRLPVGTMRTAGNQALVDFVLAQIK
jgi:hypothetical protein